VKLGRDYALAATPLSIHPLSSNKITKLTMDDAVVSVRRRRSVGVLPPCLCLCNTPAAAHESETRVLYRNPCVVAEGEELYSNVLSQICAAVVRCYSQRFYAIAISARVCWLLVRR
jgi:hypothetical protein